MPQIIKSVTLHNPQENYRRWGAVIIRRGKAPTFDYEFRTAWGAQAQINLKTKLPYNGPVYSITEATAMMNKSVEVKQIKGYEHTDDEAMRNFLYTLPDTAPPISEPPQVLASTNVTISAPEFLKKEPGCAYCALSGTTNFQESTAVCTICHLTAQKHARSHPHRSVNIASTGCVQFSLTPSQWAQLGWNAMMQKVEDPLSEPPSLPSYDPNCEVCVRSRLPDFESWYKTHVCECGDSMGEHIGNHPHRHGRVWNGSERVEHPSCEAFRLYEAPKLTLADLPCNCGERHYLSLHGKRTGSFDGACMIMTCSCETYRRSCLECGETTRTAWRHRADCMTGLRERLDAEPSGDQEQEPVFLRKTRTGIDKLSQN